MKLNKKFFAVLAAALSLTLGACNNTPSSSSSSIDPTPSTSSSEYVDPTSIHVTGVTLNRTAYEGAIGDTFNLVATVAPANAWNPTVIWSTDDMTVATVANGTVTCTGYGEATITAKAVDGGFAATCKVNVVDYIQIVTISDDYVTISCDDDDAIFVTTQKVKKTGEVYDYYNYQRGCNTYLTVEFDETEVQMQGVIIYNAETGYALGICGTQDGRYYYPLDCDLELVIAVPIYKVRADATVTYSVINENADAVAIEAVDGLSVGFGYVESTDSFENSYAAVPGELVTFKFNILSGYSFAGEVYVTDANGAVTVLNNGNGTYSFIMPEGDVSITVAVTAAYYTIDTKTYDEYGLIKSVLVDGVAWERNYVPFGSQVAIILNLANDTIEPSGIYLAEFGQSVDINASTDGKNGDAVVFTMPDSNLTIIPDGYYRYTPYVCYDDTHVQLIPVAYDAEANTITPLEEEDMYMFLNDTIYFYPVVDDGYALDYVAVGAYGYFRYSYTDTSIYMANAAALTPMANGLWSFTLKNRFYCGIDIYEEEQTLIPYMQFFCSAHYIGHLQNSGIEGYYLGVNFYSNGYVYANKQYAVYEEDYTTSDGSMITSYDRASHMGIYETSSGYERAFYGDGAIYMYGGKADTVVSGDMYVYVKIVDIDNDLASDYTFETEVFGNNKFYVMKVSYKGALYRTLFVDVAANKFYLDVTFDMLIGSKLTDGDAAYQVMYRGESIYTVGCEGNKTGKANRKVYAGGGYQGMFNVSNGKTMYLDGLGHAKYDGKVYDVTFDGRNATAKLHGGSESFIFYIWGNLHYIEFGKVGPNEPEFDVPEEPQEDFSIVGKSYSGQGSYFSSSTGGSGTAAETFVITFKDATHVRVSCLYNSDEMFDLYDEETENLCTYKVDGNLVTVTFYADYYQLWYEYDMYVWVFELSADGSTLTFKSGERAEGSDGYYHLPTGVLSLNN